MDKGARIPVAFNTLDVVFPNTGSFTLERYWHVPLNFTTAINQMANNRLILDYLSLGCWGEDNAVGESFGIFAYLHSPTGQNNLTGISTAVEMGTVTGSGWTPGAPTTGPTAVNGVMLEATALSFCKLPHPVFVTGDLEITLNVAAGTMATNDDFRVSVYYALSAIM